MKKSLTILFFLAIAITAMASSPKLASEKIFDELDVYDPSLSITIVEKKDKTVKSVTFKNNQDLQKKIKKAMTADKDKATSKTFSSDKGEISEYFDIVTDDQKIKIGFNQSRSNETYFFITIVPISQQTRSNTQKTKATKKTNKTKASKKSNRTIREMTETDGVWDFDLDPAEMEFYVIIG